MFSDGSWQHLATPDGSDVEQSRRPRRPPKFMREMRSSLEQVQREMQILQAQVIAQVNWFQGLMNTQAHELQNNLQVVQAGLAEKVDYQDFYNALGVKVNRCTLELALGSKVDHVMLQESIATALRDALGENAGLADLQALQAFLNEKANHQDLRNSLVDKVSTITFETALGGKLDHAVLEHSLTELRSCLDGQVSREALEGKADLADLQDLQSLVRGKVNYQHFQTSLGEKAGLEDLQALQALVADNVNYQAFQDVIGEKVSTTAFQAALRNTADRATLQRPLAEKVNYQDFRDKLDMVTKKLYFLSCFSKAVIASSFHLMPRPSSQNLGRPALVPYFRTCHQNVKDLAQLVDEIVDHPLRGHYRSR